MADIELRYNEAGSGEPAIVLIHGFCSGPEDWDAQAAHLGKRHTVLSVALRGHGISERGSAEMSMEQLAADCLEILKDKGITRAVLGGHSMGTRVAIDAHRQSPETVAGLILVDGSNSTAIVDMGTAMAGFETTVAENGYEAFANSQFAQMFFNPKFDKLKKAYIARALAVPEEIGKPLFANLIRWDGTASREAIGNANIPILVVQSTTRDAAGGRRALEPGEVGVYEKLVQACAPHAEVVGLPGLGHYTMIEAPEDVNAAIDSWLDRHDLRS